MADEVSVSEVAAALGVSSTVVYRLVKRGDLAPARTEMLGRQRRQFFRAADVEALKRRREGTQGAEGA